MRSAASWSTGTATSTQKVSVPTSVTTGSSDRRAGGGDGNLRVGELRRTPGESRARVAARRGLGRAEDLPLALGDDLPAALQLELAARGAQVGLLALEGEAVVAAVEAKQRLALAKAAAGHERVGHPAYGSGDLGRHDGPLRRNHLAARAHVDVLATALERGHLDQQALILARGPRRLRAALEEHHEHAHARGEDDEGQHVLEEDLHRAGSSPSVGVLGSGAVRDAGQLPPSARWS